MSRLLTAREVGELLGVSTETVLRWVRAGKLPSIRMPGGALRFRKCDIEEWLDERATLTRGDVTHPVERRSGATISLSPTPKGEE